MQINVKLEDHEILEEVETGGYAEVTVNIGVDSILPPRKKREVVIHEIIEVYCSSWEHNKIEELTDLIQDGLDQLEALCL